MSISWFVHQKGAARAKMGILGDAMKSGVISESIRASGENLSTIAKVTRTDEANNVCSIVFVNKNGHKAEIKKASVDLRNQGWFPSVGDLVKITVSGKSAMIESKYVEDYTKDVRSTKQMINDVSTDGDGTCCGSIF